MSFHGHVRTKIVKGVDIETGCIGRDTGKRTGMTNARVLPEPVLAAPSTSLPVRECGKAAL